MIKKIKHYLGVYKMYIHVAYAQALSFRINFILYLFLDLAFYFSSIGTVYVIYQHTDVIGPWTQYEFMFFVAFMLFLDYWDLTFITIGFWKFSEHLRLGTFDFILLKPTNGIFTCFFSNIRAATMCNGILPLGLLLYFAQKAELPTASYLLLPFLTFLALTLLFAIEILIAMVMFWLIESWAINVFRVQCKEVARWPDFVYALGFRRVFTFVCPLLMIGSAPTRFLFDHQSWPLILAMVALSGICIILVKLTWQLGLLQYESASS